MAKRNFKWVRTQPKLESKKNPLILGLISSVVITIFLIYLIVMPPKQGMFGSSIEFTKFLLILPFFLLMFSLIFHETKDKLIFLYISLIPVYILLVREVFHTNFDKFIVNLSFGYFLFPIVVVFGIEIIKNIFNRGIKK